ncbi:MAG: antibiotic biosynthesis monooxygenase [Candidatus Omnitrophica bacterium]|nr:antibiotic biosynthesis monooxygenase [Candidatus Omnitrophota bacterium]
MKKKVIARIYIKKEFVEMFKKFAGEIIQKTRKEKGCLLYSLFQDVSRPQDFLFYEEYADQEALDIHFNSKYLSNFRAKTKDLLAKETVVEVI